MSELLSREEILRRAGLAGRAAPDAADQATRTALIRLRREASDRPPSDSRDALLLVIRAVLSGPTVDDCVESSAEEDGGHGFEAAADDDYETGRFTETADHSPVKAIKLRRHDFLGAALSAPAPPPAGSALPTPVVVSLPAPLPPRQDPPMPKRRKRALKPLPSSFPDAQSVVDAHVDVDDDDDESRVNSRLATYDAKLARWVARWRSAAEGASPAERDQAARDPASPTGPPFTAGPPPDVSLDDFFSMRRYEYSLLYPYQRTGVAWLHELRRKKVGGLLGDEMGLGKTVQVAEFLFDLKSRNLDTPCLLVCPATTLGQWLSELHRWAPSLKVFTMHSSSSTDLRKEKLLNAKFPIIERRSSSSSLGDVCLTTYAGLKSSASILCDPYRVRFEYVVLDEGHVIKNPDAEVTMVAKSLPTVNRIILTGAPIQNNLTELWSLMDFCVPGLLGTLPHFQTTFSKVIDAGSYKNANSTAVHLAYQSAKVLKSVIEPYVLRRTKADVDIKLPSKIEQVLFCPLTGEQRSLYVEYLRRPDVRCLLEKSTKDRREDKRKALTFRAIRGLQKICNHPALTTTSGDDDADDHQKLVERCGKLLVLQRVLRGWIFDDKRKTLVFSQSTKMLDILQVFLNSEGISFARMDGSTAIKKRTRLIAAFNNSDVDECAVFLLSTKVGGLGVNLVGASRVVLYDPDWNPSTDSQARERVYRLGQSKDVVVYRLVSSGTIEEKIYHRAVYKSFLTAKVLDDPRQRRFFKSNALRDLFTLDSDTSTETLFSSNGVDVSVDAAHDEQHDGLLDGALSHDKVEKASRQSPEAVVMRDEAYKIARRSAEALRRERERVARTSAAFAPTWTGLSGSGGAPSHALGGRGSRALLSAVRNGAGTAADSAAASESHEVRYWRKLASELEKFLAEKPRSSERVLSKFRSSVERAPDSRYAGYVFRSLLKELAHNEDGKWKLMSR